MDNGHYREAIDEIVEISQRIDALAEEHDWLSMNELVEQRMHRLNYVFGLLQEHGVAPLESAEKEKLAGIATSNKRILAGAKARREEIAECASAKRVGTAAVQAYSNFTTQ